MQLNFDQQRKDYELLRIESKQQMQGYFDLQRRDYEQVREEKQAAERRLYTANESKLRPVKKRL